MSLVQAKAHRLAVAALSAGLALAGLGLAGCGRKGPLELPPGVGPDPVTRAVTPKAAAPAPQAAGVAQAANAALPGPVVDDPGLIQPPNKSYQIPASTQMGLAASSAAPPPINRPPGPKPGTPFALDPLL